MTRKTDGFGITFESVLESSARAGRSHSTRAKSLLRELLENGQASTVENGVWVSYDELCELTGDELSTLGLPSSPPYKLRIQSVGTLNEPDFGYDFGFYDGSGGARMSVTRKGILLDVGEECYTLSKAQYRLCQMLEDFNKLSQDERTYTRNLVQFAEVKILALDAEAELDPYLANESAVIPKKIELTLERNEDDTVTILPTIYEDDSGRFSESFKRFPNVRNPVPIANEDGERTRYTFGEKQVQALREVKKREHSSGEELEKIIEHPEDYFDSDVINLDGFSRRVAEIGLYKPKYSAFVSPYKSDWVPGLLVETSADTRIRIVLESEEKLDEMEEMYLAALREKRPSITVDGCELPLQEAQNFIDESRKHFADKTRRVSGTNGAPPAGKKVLLIKENIDSLEFSEVLVTGQSLVHNLEIPKTLSPKFSLLPHQEEGLAWLQSAFEKHMSGVLLADDMGLGKTVQVLSFFEWHRSRYNQKGQPYLVVAPVSLLENWEEEYHKFFPEGAMKIASIYGGEGKKIVDSIASTGRMPEELGDSVLCLTTYETLRKQQKRLCAIDWACVAIDEAQRIKTPGTLVTNAAKALNSRFKIAMTGTPVENSYVDLWCIVDFCAPGLLASAKEFAARYQRPLKKEGCDVAQIGEDLRQAIGFYLKRRLKSDVAKDLPEKVEHVCEEMMPSIQLDSYQEVVSRVHDLKSSGDGQKGYMLQALQEMRDISAHPYLQKDDLDQQDTAHLIDVAAKLLAIVPVLKSIEARDEKAIIFSESRAMQQMLVRVLETCFGLAEVSIVNGSTPAGKQKANRNNPSRQQTINRFQAHDGFNVIVMSPLAAGVGLNVTAANHVIHFSRHYNPAKEAQATDRAYRIGQTKDVHVYYLLAVAEGFDTFDVVLNGLLERKKELANASLYPSEMVEVRTMEILAAL